MNIEIKEFNLKYINDALKIWNEIVKNGNAFPQIKEMTKAEAIKFFNSQSFTGLAFIKGELVGLYILHPNNIGRCSHIANASYAVKKAKRGYHIGEVLVRHSIKKASELDFKILQFNAVVISNIPAIKLYEKLGFEKLGIIPKGYLNKNNEYEDIISYIYEIKKDIT